MSHGIDVLSGPNKAVGSSPFFRQNASLRTPFPDGFRDVNSNNPPRMLMVARHVTGRVRSAWGKVRHFVLHSILHADDPPRRLALGAAVGMFITFTPTFGFQMLLVVFAAWLLRANKAVGLPIVWISNPATMMIIYYPCYFIGRILLGREPIGQEWWIELRQPPPGWWPAVSFYWSHLLEVATPLWLGCLVVATCVAVPTYYLVYHVIRAYRLRRWGQLTPPLENG